ncbi:hypothetical protein ACQP3C_27355, partial [Escherichia coli]
NYHKPIYFIRLILSDALLVPPLLVDHILPLEQERRGKGTLPVSPLLKYESPCYVTSCLDHHLSTVFPRILFDS